MLHLAVPYQVLDDPNMKLLGAVSNGNARRTSNLARDAFWGETFKADTLVGIRQLPSPYCDWLRLKQQKPLSMAQLAILLNAPQALANFLPEAKPNIQRTTAPKLQQALTHPGIFQALEKTGQRLRREIENYNAILAFLVRRQALSRKQLLRLQDRVETGTVSAQRIPLINTNRILDQTL